MIRKKQNFFVGEFIDNQSFVIFSKNFSKIS